MTYLSQIDELEKLKKHILGCKFGVRVKFKLKILLKLYVQFILKVLVS